MTDESNEHSDDAIEQNTPPAPDAFGLVATLLAVVVDAPACTKRLGELRAATAAAAHAQEKLTVARAAHDKFVAGQLAELEKQRQELVRKEVALRAGFGKLEHNTEVLDRERANMDSQRQRFAQVGGATGITREYSDVGESPFKLPSETPPPARRPNSAPTRVHPNLSLTREAQ